MALRDSVGMQMYARVHLMRALKREVKGMCDPVHVDECIRDGFAGDAREFERSALAYIEGGCGVPG